MREGDGPAMGSPSASSARLGWRFQSRDQAQQRGLAAAARTEQSHELARLDIQVDVVQHRQGRAFQLEAVIDAAHRQRRRRRAAAAPNPGGCADGAGETDCATATI